MAVIAPARRRMRAEERREQILDIAHAIVDAEGFHAATPSRIADAAGITRPVLYQQFGDLGGLFVALIDREAERAGAQFVAAIAEPDPDADPDPFVRAFDGALRAVDSHPATWRLFLLPPQGAPPELHRRIALSQEQVVQYLAQELRRSDLALTDPEYTARMIHAAGRELLCLRLTDPKQATTERLRALVRDLRKIGHVA
ncbi:MAG TPA: TetR/AcrR family transcriptional regulator [Mycobacteriales bacterium]|jgi:AcrR family transcriptional regulator|nr:TetR/AcrR family transcriptional regulator [Mycobacteriales bacterium]